MTFTPRPQPAGLITTALPYANGPLHLGHIVENVQADVFARFSRLAGADLKFVCASDAHGAPIELNAAKQGISPEALVERFRAEHERDFRDFGISFDNYHTTHSDENRAIVLAAFEKMKALHLIHEREIEQLFCEKDGRFLPDRFVRGTCPNCGARNQYGDGCESCKRAYSTDQIKDPTCALCGGVPVRRKTTHLFVSLARNNGARVLLEGLAHALQPEVKGYVLNWLKEGLRDWCISRDAPYFGIEIPGYPGKYFYVWFDAPFGYLASLQNLAAREGFDREQYWPELRHDSNAQIYHFIGKDIIYFHALFWPYVLYANSLALPYQVRVHGMLNMGSEKMSKSRGGMVTARQWLNVLDPSYLRYYFAANLGLGIDDIEFSADAIRNRVNSQLVNNIGNFCNRSLSFLAKHFEGVVMLPSEEGRAECNAALQAAWDAYGQFNYREAIRQIEQLAAFGNEFMQRTAPWKSIKEDRSRAHADVSRAVCIVRALALLLSPVVPALADELYDQLGWPKEKRLWNEANLKSRVEGHRIGTPRPLIAPIDEDTIKALVKENTDG